MIVLLGRQRYLQVLKIVDEGLLIRANRTTHKLGIDRRRDHTLKIAPIRVWCSIQKRVTLPVGTSGTMIVKI